ncbi:MAG: HAMP domain-containing protein, partial [Chloroflexi bacterium]
YLFIVTRDGQVLAHTFSDRVPDGLLRANTLKDGAISSQVWRSEGEGRVLDIAERFTLVDGQPAIVRLGLSDREVASAVSGVTRQLIITSGLMSLVGVAAAVFLTWIITRPIRNLVQATQAVARGDLTQRVQPWANDEIGRLAEAFNAMTGTLAQAAREQAERHTLRAQFVSRVIAAQEEERRRIARELHDSTSQSLTSLLVGLQALEQAGDGDVGRRSEDLRQIVSKTLEEVHGLAWQLRPSALDDLGLTAALERYIADYQERYQLPVDFTIHGIDHGRLSPEMETTIYRIVQEALTNVARHAHATRASVIIDQRDGKTLVIVEDDGIGLDAAAKASRDHLGLYGIRERAELLGGKLTIEAEHGTSLFVELPNKDTHDGST